jgi:hypothetical protein
VMTDENDSDSSRTVSLFEACRFPSGLRIAMRFVEPKGSFKQRTTYSTIIERDVMTRIF